MQAMHLARVRTRGFEPPLLAPQASVLSSALRALGWR
jgi:hypothetical protein